MESETLRRKEDTSVCFYQWHLVKQTRVNLSIYPTRAPVPELRKGVEVLKKQESDGREVRGVAEKKVDHSLTQRTEKNTKHYKVL